MYLTPIPHLGDHNCPNKAPFQNRLERLMHRPDTDDAGHARNHPLPETSDV
jgi:hypothetical protein